MHFPHAFNRQENYEVELDHLPDIKYYRPDSMMPEQREEFLRWHAENWDQKFKLADVIADYCHTG